MKVINDELGGWPMISGKSNPYSSLELLKRVNKYILTDFVIITVGANPKDPFRNIIKVGYFFLIISLIYGIKLFDIIDISSYVKWTSI